MPKGTGGKGQARGAKSKRKKRQREKRKESNDATATRGTSQAKITRGTTSDHKEYSSNWKALAKVSDCNRSFAITSFGWKSER